MSTHTKAPTLLFALLLTLTMLVFSGCEKVQVLHMSSTFRFASDEQDINAHTFVNATVRRIKIRYPLSMSTSQETSTAACRIDKGDSIPTNPDADVIHLMFDPKWNDPKLTEGDRVRFWFNPEGQFRRFTKLKPESGL